jgi:hypothetical protein
VTLALFVSAVSPAGIPEVCTCAAMVNVAVAPAASVPTLKVMFWPATVTAASCDVAAAAPLLNATDGAVV